jgi:hypothetical protein
MSRTQENAEDDRSREDLKLPAIKNNTKK